MQTTSLLGAMTSISTPFSHRLLNYPSKILLKKTNKHIS